MAEKSLVFISHISEEKEVAVNLKELIEDHFLGMVDVFVSSDGDSIQAGQRWLTSITESLETCSIEIVLASPKSIKRPWINFEAGAGWIRQIPVVPICHSGLSPSDLPVPLNMLQAVTISEVSGLRLLFTVIAQALQSRTPDADFSSFLEEINNFEEQYTFWNDFNKNIKQLEKLNSEALRKALKIEKIDQFIKTKFSAMDEDKLQVLADYFFEKDFLEIRGDGSTMMGPGVWSGYIIRPLSKYFEIISDSNFVYQQD